MSDSDFNDFTNNKNKSISCFNIPKYFLDKKVAKTYFSKFGKVVKFILNPKRLSCTVEYDSFNSADNAIKNAGIFHDEEFDILWAKEESEAENIVSKYGSDLLYDTKRDIFAMPPRVKSVDAKIISEKLELKREYEAIMIKPAYTSEEKYRVLDARDKLLRLSMNKLTDIQKATSTKGICPDMCPEKERLMREAKHQIASYELEPNTRDKINHTCALKQYSRSSADQESPLSHELRPESVLQLTMNYLLHKIIILCDTSNINISDWFHFIWDRTRSIRKDITQQELCSKDAVTLVEQCARFHIHCAARLINEEPSVFDQKINTENLTKCLQSLKYMYHDLTLKNIKCPNEVEFRGYIILLNLKDSNFLWEIKQLPDDIKKSNEIRFAIDVYLAIDTNNYVKFFNLVKNANYLNACILLRYFNQVRTKALIIILKSYTLRTPINLSITYLTNVLAFEDNENTIQFLEYNGLICDRNTVSLDKSYFFTPDIPFMLERAMNIVEKKRTCSSSEIICGTQLQSIELVEHYKPHNSFDKNGYLKMNAWDLKDHDPVINEDDIADEDDEEEDEDDYIENVEDLDDDNEDDDEDEVDDDEDYTKDDYEPKKDFSFIKKSTKQLIPKIIHKPFNIPVPPSFLISTNKSPFSKPESTSSNENSFKIGNTNPFVQQEFKKNPFLNSFNKIEPLKENPIIINEKCKSPEVIIKSSVINENQFFKPILQPDIKYQQQQEQKFVDNNKKENSIKKQIEIDKFIDDIINITLKEEIKNLIDIEVKRKIDNNTFLMNEVKIIVNEFINEYLTDLIDDEIIYRKYTIYRYLKRWQKKVKNIIIKRDKIEDTPIWLPNLTIDERNKTLNCYKPNKKLPIIVLPINNDNNKQKINIFDVIMNDLCLLNNNNKNNIYWKLLCSIPDQNESKQFHYFINNWLTNCFSTTKKHEQYLLLEQKSFNPYKCVSICVRKVIGNFINENLKECKEIGNNMNCLLFFINSNDLNLCTKRLNNILYETNYNLPLKLSIIICNKQIEHKLIIDSLKLNHLINIKKISEFNIEYTNIINNNCVDLMNKTILSLKYLAKNYRNENYLEMQETIIFLNNCLGDEIWKRFDKLLDSNQFILATTININLVINLYNFAIDQVIKLIDKNLNDYQSLPNEFNIFIKHNSYHLPLNYEYFPINWKSNNRREIFIEFFNELKLKQFQTENFQNLFELEKELLFYLKDILKLTNSKIIFYEIIKLIRISFDYFEQNNYGKFNEITFNKKLSNLSWLSIVKIIALSNIEKIYKNFQKLSLPNEIIYNRNEYNLFINTSNWLTTEISQCNNDLTTEPLNKKKKMNL